jgi:D-amino-acid dehydrogenase
LLGHSRAVSKLVVIGGGVIGLCTAWYASCRGHEVVVVDRADESHEGCSYGNAGMICPSHFVPLAAPGMVKLGLKWMWNPKSPFYIQPRADFALWDWGFKFWRAANAEHVRRASPVLRDLHLASRACFEELAALPGNDFGLVKKGLIMLCKTDSVWHEEAHAAEQARALGVPAEVLDAQQTAKLDPGIRMDIAGAVYFPLDCHLSPNQFMAGLKAQLVKQGVVFSWQNEVVGWRTGNSRVVAVQTTAGEIAGDEFALCGGAWSPATARSLRLKLPMQAGKGYSLTLPRPRQRPAICAILTEARIAVTPMGDSLRFGGTMEIAGVNETINPIRVQGIVESVPKYYPEIREQDFAGIRPWAGLRPCSPDGLPYLGRTARFANLTIATGHAMMGLSLGPITGKIAADIISHEPPPIEIGLLSPDRYM